MKAKRNRNPLGLIPELRDPEFATAYIRSGMEEADMPFDSHDLKEIVRACRICEVTRKTGLTRRAIHQMISYRGNPTLKNLTTLLHAVGLQLTIEPLTKARRE
jgi:probable addiction module antidote protein